MLVAGAVVVASVLLVAGQSLMNRTAPSLPGSTATLSSAVMSGAASSPSSSSPPASSTPTAPSAPTAAVLPPLPRSQVGLKPVSPDGPLAAGRPLPPLSTSPASVISGLQQGVVPSGSAYKVTLRPWGMGPPAPQGRTAVVTIYSILPSHGAPASLTRFKGRVLLVVMDAKGGGTIERGGTYTAFLTFVAAAGRLVPVLTEVVVNGS